MVDVLRDPLINPPKGRRVIGQWHAPNVTALLPVPPMPPGVQATASAPVRARRAPTWHPYNLTALLPVDVPLPPGAQVTASAPRRALRAPVWDAYNLTALLPVPPMPAGAQVTASAPLWARQPRAWDSYNLTALLPVPPMPPGMATPTQVHQARRIGAWDVANTVLLQPVAELPVGAATKITVHAFRPIAQIDQRNVTALLPVPDFVQRSEQIQPQYRVRYIPTSQVERNVALYDETVFTVVPDVVGLSTAAATASIQGVGLVESASTAKSRTVAAGLVISQSPAAGSSVASGTTVSFVVSTGSRFAGSRNYLIKGKRYHLTNEELAYMLARDLIEVRADVKVTYTNKKPRPIGKEAWASLQQMAQRFDADQDEEEAAMLLLQ